MEVTKRTDRSILGRLVQLILKPIGRFIGDPSEDFSEGSPELTPPAFAKKRCHISPRKVCGIWIYDMTVKSAPLHYKVATKVKEATEKDKAQDAPLRRIYYIAGGTWQAPPSPHHWKLCTELCYKIPNCTVSIISCPLAPRCPAPKTFSKLLELYHEIMKEPEEITLAGDSSGGNIVLCMVLAALSDPKQDYPKAPQSILVISPSADLTEMDANDPVLKEVQKRDPILTFKISNTGAARWAGDWDRADPRLTPMNADVSLLAKRGIKLYGVTGGNDIRSPAAIEFREKCSAAGVEGEWLEWDGQMHCFPLTWVYGLRESKEGKDWMVDVLKRPVAPRE